MKRESKGQRRRDLLILWEAPPIGPSVARRQVIQQLLVGAADKSRIVRDIDESVAGEMKEKRHASLGKAPDVGMRKRKVNLMWSCEGIKRKAKHVGKLPVELQDMKKLAHGCSQSPLFGY